MPKPPKGNEDAGKEPPAPKHLSRPVRETSMRPGKNHPQRLAMIQRDRMKPCETLEDWFDMGLVKQHQAVGQGSKPKKIVTGIRPLPMGYSGCDGDHVMIEAGECKILIWPLRLYICVGADEQKPWTLYHYTHAASFENFHRTFHDLHQMEPTEANTAILDLLQLDYQERVPTPTPQNIKGEPMLTCTDPSHFQTKEDCLLQIFGKEASNMGFSKQGNKYDTFADYCIAVSVPATACFQNTTQMSIANVRISREVLEQLANKAVKEDEVKRKKRVGSRDDVDSKDERSAKPKGCLAMLCGFKRADQKEFWDDGDDKQHTKKKDREMDRWKQRLAKKWLDEHVSEVAKMTAEEHKKKEEEMRRVNSEKRHQINRQASRERKVTAMQVNKRSKGTSTLSLDMLDMGATSYFTKLVSKFTSLTKKKDDPDVPYVKSAEKEVVQASALFNTYNRAATGDLQDNEAKAADEKLKRRRVNEEKDPKHLVPQGTKRRVVMKKKKASSEMEGMAMDPKKSGHAEHEAAIALAEAQAVERAHELQLQKEEREAKHAAHVAKHSAHAEHEHDNEDHSDRSPRSSRSHGYEGQSSRSASKDTHRTASKEKGWKVGVHEEHTHKEHTGANSRKTSKGSVAFARHHEEHQLYDEEDHEEHETMVANADSKREEQRSPAKEKYEESEEGSDESSEESSEDGSVESDDDSDAGE